MTVHSTLSPIGLGLWKIDRDQTATVVRDAIDIGYRHIDSAADYGNEREAGDGIRQALSEGLCTRDDLWVTSKLWNTFHAPEHVPEAIDKTLSDLQLDYLDLYLIHFPIAMPYVAISDRYPPEWISDASAAEPGMQIAPVPLHETWAAMERLVDNGKVKRIGVCNYNTALVHDLMAYARIKPAMLQIESHPYLTQEALLRVAGGYGIPVTAFSPLGALSYVPIGMAKPGESVLESSVVARIAERIGKTPAQVVLRWGIDRGCAVIPKTTRKSRLAENFDILDFTLDANDIAAIAALNQDRRFNDPGVFCEQAFGRFHPIYD